VIFFKQNPHLQVLIKIFYVWAFGLMKIQPGTPITDSQ